MEVRELDRRPVEGVDLDRDDAEAGLQVPDQDRVVRRRVNRHGGREAELAGVSEDALEQLPVEPAAAVVRVDRDVVELERLGVALRR